MDSAKMLRGYQRVEAQDQHHRNPKPLIATISILFLIFTVAFALASILHRHGTATESPELLLNSAESIRVVCNVTRFPSACLAAITPSPNATDPLAILSLSLRASIHALRGVASSLPPAKPHALSDCKDQVADALGRLDDSLSAAAALSEAAVADLHTWLSAALTDLQTCLDGLEEVGDAAAVAEMTKLMQRSNEYTSNSLAIVANIRNLLSKFHITLH
ncbi:hypothetical protein Fmac_008727 [Flemingia macrophylla]|uniref:pectinesterase n=1 Tax=Flemingia macrophylla TaxID=520843 RepID=A0ABD1MZ36_9FABA